MLLLGGDCLKNLATVPCGGRRFFPNSGMQMADNADGDLRLRPRSMDSGFLKKKPRNLLSGKPVFDD